jgi:hypothetical protein
MVAAAALFSQGHPPIMPLASPSSTAARSSKVVERDPEGFLRIGLLQFELILIGVAAAVSVLFWVFGNPPSIGPTLIFTLIVGNLTALVIDRTIPQLEDRSLLQSWVFYLAVLVPAGAIGSLIAALTLLTIYHYPAPHAAFFWTNLRFGTLVSVLTGISIYSVVSTRAHWQARNRLLEEQVAVGAVRLTAQEADLKTAHEIQAHLLPRELPVIPGMEIA